MLRYALRQQGGGVQCLAKCHGFTKLLARSSSGAAQVAETTERIEKEQQPAVLPQENLSVQAGAGAAETAASAAASAVDNSKVVAVYAGIVALLGSTYLLVSSGKKPKRAPHRSDE